MGRVPARAARCRRTGLERLGIGRFQHFPDRFVQFRLFHLGIDGFCRFCRVFGHRGQWNSFRLWASEAGFHGFHAKDSGGGFDKSNDLGLGYRGKQPFASEEQQERHEI